MQQRYRRYRFLIKHKARKLDKHVERHPLRWLVVLMATSLIIGFSLLFVLTKKTDQKIAIDAHVVILYADKKTQTLPTREQTVGKFLDKADIKLNEGDVVEPSVDAKIEEDYFRINVYRAAPVVVYDNGVKINGLSAAKTARSIAEQVGVKLFAEDLVTAEPSSDFLKDGSIANKVVVERSVPINLNLYGTQLDTRTHAKTVGELLTEKRVRLNQGDTVTPKTDTPVSQSLQVFVARYGTEVITQVEDIVADTQTVQDSSLSFGTTVTRQAGSNGKRSVTYQIEKKNGVEVGRKLIQQVIIQQAVTKIIARGQAVRIPSDKEGLMRSAGIADSDFPYVYFIINHENGLWCPTRWQGTQGCPEYYYEKFPGAETNTSTGYGLCQSTPAIKMATAGEDWRTNAVTQLRWCSSYAKSRHGGWAGAYNYWVSHNNW